MIKTLYEIFSLCFFSFVIVISIILVSFEINNLNYTKKFTEYRNGTIVNQNLKNQFCDIDVSYIHNTKKCMTNIKKVYSNKRKKGHKIELLCSIDNPKNCIIKEHFLKSSYFVISFIFLVLLLNFSNIYYIFYKTSIHIIQEPPLLISQSQYQSF